MSSWLALFAWLRHSDDLLLGMIEVLEAGGDTDTTGAIFGALAGGAVGESGIPKDWLYSVREWPCSLSFIALLALNDDGAPAFDHNHAAAFASLKIPCFACTPDLFPDLMAAAIQRQNISQWASTNGLASKRAKPQRV